MEIPLSTVVIIHIFSLGKKRCWVHDWKNAYVEAEVKESDADGKVIVETSDGEVKKRPYSFWGCLYSLSSQVTRCILSLTLSPWGRACNDKGNLIHF